MRYGFVTQWQSVSEWGDAHSKIAFAVLVLGVRMIGVAQLAPIQFRNCICWVQGNRSVIQNDVVDTQACVGKCLMVQSLNDAVLKWGACRKCCSI